MSLIKAGVYLRLCTLLPVTIFLLFVVPKNALTEESVPKTEETGPVPCKGLKPYNNLDELLYQFYINLDSDCLFKLPVKELEALWNVKIENVERSRRNPEYAKLLKESTDFFTKPYKSERDAFYISIDGNSEYYVRNVFKIKITKEYFEKHATLFPDGNFPRLLPDPVPEPRRRYHGFSKNPLHRPKKEGRYYLSDLYYCWISPDKKHKITMGGDYGVTEIKIR